MDLGATLWFIGAVIILLGAMVVALLTMTHYFDGPRDMGAQSNTVLLPHSPSAVTDLNTQLRNAITSGSLAAMKSLEKPDGVK